MKVLFILNNAPDYRESFLNGLSKECELTVYAGSCKLFNLNNPSTRGSYSYFEFKHVKIFGIYFPLISFNKINFSTYDVVCCSFNPRNPFWIILFFLSSTKIKKKWIWWGQIFGKHKSLIFSFLRKISLSKSSSILVYSNRIVNEIKSQFNINSISFNNSEVLISEFRKPNYHRSKKLNLIFVGRFQPRKRLDRLVKLIHNREDVSLRLIGPGMIEAFGEIKLKNLEIFERCVGAELNEHFDWAHVVMNPGHLGLLVLNAARHGKPIVVDKNSNHAPEVILAKESNQPFINFSNFKEVSKYVDYMIMNKNKLRELANELQEKAIMEYTVENMIKIHNKVFKKVYKRSKFEE